MDGEHIGGAPAGWTEDVSGLLQAWSRGDYTRVPTGQDPTSAALRAFAQALRDQRTDELSHTVGLSVTLNDTARVFVDLVTDLRKVDDQTAQSAAAAEEMQATNQNILTTTRSIAADAETTRQKMDAGAASLQASSAHIERIVTATNEVQGKVQALIDLSKAVSRISGTISQIANQTNLLALNATIEAARAGESGRGFAVVAGEVKELSQETAKATVEIEEIIARIQEETSHIAKAAHENHQAVSEGQSAIHAVTQEVLEVKDRVDHMVGEVQEIADILDEQQLASSQVAQSVTAIAGLSDACVRRVGAVVDAVDDMESQLVNKLTDLAALDLHNKVVKLAQSDHVIWKKRLLMMMMGRAQLNPKELADNHSCRLGKWYDGVKDPAMRGHPAFQQLAGPHERVHTHGIKAAQFITDGDFEAGLAAIVEMERASEDVMRLLRQLDAEL